MSIFCIVAMLLAPAYLVIFRKRFWAGVIVAWFFLVATTHFSVWHHLIYANWDEASPGSDATSVGLTLFSGWLLALPYCGLLVLVRLALRCFGLSGGDKVEQD